MLTHADNKVFFVPQILLSGGGLNECSWFAYPDRMLCVHRSLLVIVVIETQVMKDHDRS